MTYIFLIKYDFACNLECLYIIFFVNSLAYYLQSV